MQELCNCTVSYLVEYDRGLSRECDLRIPADHQCVISLQKEIGDQLEKADKTCNYCGPPCIEERHTVVQSQAAWPSGLSWAGIASEFNITFNHTKVITIINVQGVPVALGVILDLFGSCCVFLNHMRHLRVLLRPFQFHQLPTPSSARRSRIYLSYCYCFCCYCCCCILYRNMRSMLKSSKISKNFEGFAFLYNFNYFYFK